MRRLVQLSLLIVFLSTAAFAQPAFFGKVVDVTDGRTLILETSAGRIVTQLQYVEVPEQGQPLFSATRDHLSKLTLGKSVSLKPYRILHDRTIGWMTLDGVDLSLQMIRDGAAWHEPSAGSGQSPIDAADYDANQTLAKTEKRGIWSVPGLKPPWDVRAEKEKTKRAADVARKLARPTLVGVSEFQSDIRRPSGKHVGSAGISERLQRDTWVSVFAGAGKESYGLQTYSDPQGRFSAVYTSAALVDFASASGKEKLECRAMLISYNRAGGGQGKVFLIGFRAISDDFRFSHARSRLTLLTDKQAVGLGSPSGLRRKNMLGAEELMFYKVSWATLRKIGAAKNVELRIDKRTAPLSEASRDLFKQLATATGD